MDFSRFFDIFRRGVAPGSAEVLVFGLGNPGVRYGATRHNAGFMVTDEFAGRISGIRRSRFGGADISVGVLTANRRVAAAKPLTYVNRSGRAFRALTERLRIPLDSCLVVTDDFNIPFGSLRFRRGGSDGGHNGLKSIIGEVGADFPRLRVGIGPLPGGLEVIDFVLGEFDDEQRKALPGLLADAAGAVEVFCTQGIGVAMNRYNGRQAGS